MTRKPIPKALEYISGCKVSWRVYATKEEAEAAADVARHNARIDASLGYDFGYLSPGSISPHTTEDGRECFKVCFS